MKTIKDLIKNTEFTTVEVDFDAFDKEMTRIKRATIMAQQDAIRKACQTFLNA